MTFVILFEFSYPVCKDLYVAVCTSRTKYVVVFICSSYSQPQTRTWATWTSLMWSRLTAQNVHNLSSRSCSPFVPALQPNEPSFRGRSVESAPPSSLEDPLTGVGSSGLSSSSWGLSTVSEFHSL